MGFSRPGYWSGQPIPSLGNLPNPGIEPRFPALQVDSLPAEPQGKPCYSRSCKLIRLNLEPAFAQLLSCVQLFLLCPWDSPGMNTGVGCYSFFQGIFWPRNWTWVSGTAGLIGNENKGLCKYSLPFLMLAWEAFIFDTPLKRTATYLKENSTYTDVLFFFFLT